MGSLTDYAENALLDHVFRNTALTSPTNVYVGLCTSTPTDSTGGTEVSGNNYARVQATFGAAASGATSNTSAITFPTSSGSWGTVTHFEIWDASTAGNRLGWGALSSSQVIGTNNTPSFAIGELDITLD